MLKWVYNHHPSLCVGAIEDEPEITERLTESRPGHLLRLDLDTVLPKVFA
jgi:hypothetical protein